MNTRLNRRSFLQWTSAAAALAAAAAAPVRLAAADAATKRSISKGIMLGTVGVKGSVLEQLQAVKTAGFAGVEPLSHMDADEVAAALKATGLKAPSVCCATHWDKTLTDPSAEVRAEGLEGLKQALRDAHRYGATSVLLVPGVVSEKVSYAQAYERSQTEIRKALPLAQELGVKIAIENVWNQFLLSPLEAARYVDEFNSPWVAWHFDAGNILNYGWPDQWIAVLDRRIAQIHIKEFSRKKRNDEGLWKGFDVALLKGDNDWAAIMKALDAIHYKGWIIAEQGGGDSPAGLRQISEAMDAILAM
jgi:hexulose-6-phosphate isomerase